MSSNSARVLAWQAAVATVRNSTLTSTSASSLAPVLSSAVSQLCANLAAVFELPSQEVAGDIIIIVQSVPANWPPSEAHEFSNVCCELCRLVLDLSSRIQLEYKTAAVLILVRFLRRILEGSSSRSSRGAEEDAGRVLMQHGSKAEWEALRALVQVVHEYGGQISSEETSSLLGVLLRSIKQSNLTTPDHYKRLPRTWRAETAPGEGKARCGQGDREYQRLVFTAIGNIFARAGSMVSKEDWQTVTKVLRDAVEVMVSTKPIEDAAASRSYAAALRCVHLVLSDTKSAFEEHVGGFVGALRVFFTYGLPNVGSSVNSNKTVRVQSAVTKSPSWRDAKVRNQESGAYRPPHLRGKPSMENCKLGNMDSRGSDAEGHMGWGPVSSDSELSDNDGQQEEGDRFNSSKVRTNAILSIQVYRRGPTANVPVFRVDSSWDVTTFRTSAVALGPRSGYGQSAENGSVREANGAMLLSKMSDVQPESVVPALAKADPKALHAHWVALLPTHDVLQSRPFQATLLTVLLFDPVMKARMAAASTVAVMLEGPARAFLQVAEHKEISKSKSFTTLSSSLGQLVIQLLIGLVHVVTNENHGGVLVATLKALSLLISSLPFARLPPELLPYALHAVHQRVRDLYPSPADQISVMCAAIGSVGVILSSTPSAAVAANLVTEGLPVSSKFSASVYSQPSCSHRLLPDLISYTLPPISPSIRVEAFQALKAAVHTHPSLLANYWEPISCSISRTIECPNGPGDLAEPSDPMSGTAQTCKKVALSPLILPNGQPMRMADDKVVHSAIKLLDEFLRATSGYRGTDPDFLDEGLQQSPSAFLVPKPTKLLAASSSSMSQDVTETAPIEGNGTALALWLEALHQHLPPSLVHPASMVRGAALTCFAGLTSSVFSSFPTEEQEQILSALISAAWNDDTPAVRSAACRAIGVVMSFPQVAGSKQKLDAAVNVVVSSTTDTSVSVRITASWALANICDALCTISETENRQESIFLAPLADSALKAARDCDKVRANAVRALGNLARFASFCVAPDLESSNPPEDLKLHRSNATEQDDAQASTRWLGVMVQTLVSCVTTGNVKVQWNVCHALGNLFLNKTICLSRMTWVPSVYSILLLLLRDSANYKIRIQSAAALAVPAARTDYGDSYSDVLKALVHALECMDPEHESAPSSFKYNKALTDQLTTTILHVLGLGIVHDFFALKDFLLKKAAFLQDFLTSVYISERLSSVSDPFEYETGGLSRMEDLRLAGASASEAIIHDEKPLPPPKHQSRYGIAVNDSSLASAGTAARGIRVLQLRQAFTALMEMYRYGGIAHVVQRLETLTPL